MTNQLKLPWRTQDAGTQPTIAEIRKQLCEHYAALNESERYKNPPQKLAEVAYLYGLRAEPVTSDRCAYLMWEQVVLVLIQVGMETVGLTTPPVMEWATGAVWVMRETQSVSLDDLKKLVGVILADDDTVTLEDPQLVAKVDLAYSDRTAFSAIEGTVALLTSMSEYIQQSLLDDGRKQFYLNSLLGFDWRAATIGAREKFYIFQDQFEYFEDIDFSQLTEESQELTLRDWFMKTLVPQFGNYALCD